MLDTQIVSFSGDSATASMDIQIGKGPFAPSVNGLVKIGDTLTMVVAIEGDPGFDVQVQECIAHDGNRTNAVTLTDKRGCVLKKKLMGPWQKSTETGRPGVSLIAFSFFQAFKFPDQMEVFLECNVELCKNGCDVCPDDASLVGSYSYIWNYEPLEDNCFSSLSVIISLTFVVAPVAKLTTIRRMKFPMFDYADLSAWFPTRISPTNPIPVPLWHSPPVSKILLTLNARVRLLRLLMQNRRSNPWNKNILKHY